MYSFSDWLLENKETLGTGPGLWCPLHIILMCALFVWLIVAAVLFVKYKKFAFVVATVLCYLMIFFRLFRMGLLYFFGGQNIVEVLPWHLCHVMSFVLPIFFLTKTKRFFLPVLALSFFGGILTFIFGDYYYLSTISFLQLESLWLHFSMPTVCVACIASGYFQLKLKDFWQIYVGLGLICAWSTLGNFLIKDANYLYLKENGLPFNFFPGYSFLYTYAILVIIISVIVTGGVWLFSYVRKKLKNKYK